MDSPAAVTPADLDVLSLVEIPEDGLSDLRGRTGLLVASSGGHLSELLHLVDLTGISHQSTVVTFDTPQSRSLLAGRPHRFVPYVPPRDLAGTVRTARRLTKVGHGSADFVLSTGASIAVSGWWSARRARLPFYYVESLARLAGPSLTGSILSRLPSGRLFTQHPEWSDRRWQACRNVLGAFPPGVGGTAVARARRPLRVFVTLGTIRPYRFDRLVDAVLAATGPRDTVVWQVGGTGRADLPGEVHAEMTAGAFDRAVREADVVVAQAGVGTLLRCLELGATPVVVPRLGRLGEHVDDHQVQIADLVAARRLGLVPADGVPTRADLERAATAQRMALPESGDLVR